MNKSQIVTGVVAGATALAIHKTNVLANVPKIGPVSGNVIAVLVGLAVLAYNKIDGTAGDVIDGVAFGVVAMAAGNL